MPASRIRLGLALLVLLILVGGSAPAATINMNVTAAAGDSLGAGPVDSLREAINTANADPTNDYVIDFTDNGTLTLAGTVNSDGMLPFFSNPSGITINGNGATISGNSLSRIFFVGVPENLNAAGGGTMTSTSSSTFSINNLTLQDGIAAGGNGGFATGGAGGGGAGMGGAIFHAAGTLNINAVTFSGNAALGGSGNNGSTGTFRFGAGGGGMGGNGGNNDDTGNGDGGAGGGGFGVGALGGKGDNTGSESSPSPGVFLGGEAGGGSNGGVGGAAGGGGRGGTHRDFSGGGGGVGGVTGNSGGGSPGGFGGGGGGGSRNGASRPGGSGGFGGGGGGSGAGANPANGAIGGFGGGGGGSATGNVIAGGFGGGSSDNNGDSGAGAGMGGAIFNLGGTLNIADSMFDNNSATLGGIGKALGAQGLGGAIFNTKGVLNINASTFTLNSASTDGDAIFSIGTDTSQVTDLIDGSPITSSGNANILGYVGHQAEFVNFDVNTGTSTVQFHESLGDITYRITPHDVGLPEGVQLVGGSIRTNGAIGEGVSFSELEPTFQIELTNGTTTQFLTELNTLLATSGDEPLFDVTAETITFVPDAGQFFRLTADEAPFSGFFWSGESPHDSGLLAVEVDGFSEITTPPPTDIGNFAFRAPGDANGDGIVDADDLASVLANWSTGDTYAKGDFNGDGTVDAADLSRLFGDTADPAVASAQFASVPEPSTFVLTAFGMLGLIGFRRRRNR